MIALDADAHINKSESYLNPRKSDQDRMLWIFNLYSQFSAYLK